MVSLFRHEAIEYRARRLDGEVILAGTRSTRVLNGAMAALTIVGLWLLANMTIPRTQVFDGWIASLGQHADIHHIDLVGPLPRTPTIVAGQPVRIDVRNDTGVRMRRISGRVARVRGGAVYVAARRGSAILRVEIDPVTADWLRGMLSRKDVRVTGEIETGRRSVFDWLTRGMRSGEA